MLTRVVASLLLASALLACEEIPDDPCVDILRNPFPQESGGLGIDSQQLVQNISIDAARSSLCARNMITCSDGTISSLTGECVGGATPTTVTVPSVTGIGLSSFQDIACSAAIKDANNQCARVSQNLCNTCQRVTGCSCLSIFTDEIRTDGGMGAGFRCVVIGAPCTKNVSPGSPTGPSTTIPPVPDGPVPFPNGDPPF